MAVTLLSSKASTNGATTGTALVLTAPTGVAVGDFLVAELAVGGSASAATLTAPTGWTLIKNAGGLVTSSAYYKVAVSGDVGAASWTWTASVAALHSSGVSRYSGVDTTTPIDGTPGSVSSTTNPQILPSITTTTANSLVHAVLSMDEDGSVHTEPIPTGWTVLITPPANGVTQHVGGSATMTQATAGATGTSSWAWTASYAGPTITGIIYALRPATSGSTAASAAGSITLGGSSTAQAPATTGGSIALGGSTNATGPGAASASGSITLGGSAVTKAAASTTGGSVTLSGSVSTGSTASNLYVGPTAVGSALYVGATAVTAVYAGTVQVWGASTSSGSSGLGQSSLGNAPLGA